MSVRWVGRNRAGRRAQPAVAELDQAERAYRRQQLGRQLDAERAHWESQRRSTGCL